MLTLIAFVLIVGTLVVWHELGHFLTARFFGVRVETFSIGFPPNVYSRRHGDTEYTIGLLPIGGFVKMAGGPPGEGSDDPAEIQNRTRGERLLILLAGPAMNFLLAILILAGLFYVGMERRVGLSDPPVVSYVAADSPAGVAGLRAGDRIVSIGERPAPDWRTALGRIMVAPDREVVFEVERDGALRRMPIRIRSVGEDAIGDAGVRPPAPPVLGAVEPGMPAKVAGLIAGDRITAVNGSPVGSTDEVASLIRASGRAPVSLEVDRGGAALDFEVRPTTVEDAATGQPVPRIGVRFEPPFRLVKADSVSAAIGEAARETGRWSSLTIRHLGGIVVGSASARQLSGPIGIAQASGDAFRRGPQDVLMLMAILSLSLGVLNLLPIPVLDGGQIAVLLVESVARRDLSLGVRQALMFAGAALMILVFVGVILLDLSKAGVFG